MRNRVWPIAMLVLLTLAVGAAAVAAAPAKAGNAAGRIAVVAQKLGITKEQGQEIRAILTGDGERREKLGKDVKVAKLRLSLALEEGKTGGELASLVEAYQAAAKAQRAFQAESIGKAFAVLTAEQQAKLILMGKGDWWRIFLHPEKSRLRRTDDLAL